tara:strand:- start:760 stop:966 length:207 start_codon:yes stop_codon:yes gene_type:complete
MDTTIKYKGAELNLIGDYIQAHSGGYENESYGAFYETHTVYAGGINITDLLSEDQLNDCDELAKEMID